MTNRRIWQGDASTQEQTWSQLEAWFGSPSLRGIGETSGFLEILEGFLTRPRVLGPVAHDARVAAICVAHGVEALLTRDRDFALFPELRTQDPWG